MNGTGRNGNPAVALVGVGGYGKVHYDYLKALADAGKIDFSAAVVRPASIEKRRRTVDELFAMGARIFPDEDALLGAMGGRLNLVCLPVGIEAHRPMTCKFLAAGVNVLLEKPAAGCVADVEAMIEAEKRSKGFVAVGFHNMYGRDIHAVKREILSGRYGKLVNISFKGAWHRSDNYYSRNDWAGKLRASDGTVICDSPVNNAFAHYLNIPLFCAGPDFTTTARAGAMQAEAVRSRDNIETFDTCSMRVWTEQGVTIQVLTTHACDTDREPRLRFDLERARIHWDFQSGSWRIETPDGKTVRSESSPDCRQSMFDDIIGRLGNASVFTYTLKNALEHTRCIEKLHALFPVHVLKPSEYRILRDRDNQRVIPGIVELFDEAFERNLLPSELGAPWSPGSGRKPLNDAEPARPLSAGFALNP